LLTDLKKDSCVVGFGDGGFDGVTLVASAEVEEVSFTLLVVAVVVELLAEDSGCVVFCCCAVEEDVAAWWLLFVCSK
jgi:hypothetical protein